MIFKTNKLIWSANDRPIRNFLMASSVVLLPLLFAGTVSAEEKYIFLGADKLLQKDVTQMIMIMEDIYDSDCRKPKISKKTIAEQPEKKEESVWVEKWAIDRCGKNFYYLITFTPTPSKGGTDFNVSLPPTSDDN